MYFYKLYMYFLLILCYKNTIVKSATFYLKSNEIKTYNPRSLKFSERKIQIYCYEGRPKNVINLFQTVSLQLKLDNDNYVQYDGHTEEEVKKEYEARRSSWSPNIFTWKQKYFKLDPFNQSCIGIDSDEEYSVYLHVIRIDYWKVLILALGVLLFLSGPKLSDNTLFYYICGVMLGVCASFLILIYIISKMFPSRTMMYGFVAGGWAVGIYVLQILWENVRVILTNYSNYVLYYMIGTGFVSFVLCYRMGPPTNPRSKNLIKWALQATGLIMVFNCSHYQEAAMGIIILLFIAYNFPRSWIIRSQTYWKRKFPPKVKLLSNDEYYHQGVKETNKALSELRKYCSSPECNQWKTVLKLKNAKRYNYKNGSCGVFLHNRFASFVEGNSHLSDDEILEYENDSLHRTQLTDDDDEEQMTDDSDNI